MKTRLITSRQQYFVVAALLALASVSCGGDDSGSDNPGNGDASTGGTKGDASTVKGDAATVADTGTPVTADDSGTPGTVADAGGDAATAADAATGSDAATGGDAATSHDAGSEPATIPTLNGCKPGDYMDLSAANAERTVTIQGSPDFKFTPKCVTIAAGQKVKWTGSLSGHPLDKGTDAATTGSGSPNSPITLTNAGNSVEFTFPTAGTYPYICTKHVGVGMVGSIHVK